MKHYTFKELNENRDLLTIFKSREHLTILCDACQAPFLKRKKEIIDAFTRNKKGFYCSTKCWKVNFIDLGKVILKECKNCGTQVKRVKSQLRVNSFCSSSCSAIYNNTHKTHGTRRSKLEAFLEQKFKEQYPNLIIICNDKQTINSELDFYFPELKFAIELNGIFHYEPIYGYDKLDKIQTNDKQKLIKCYEAGIELLVLDTSSLKNFNESKGLYFFSIINEQLCKIISRSR